MISIFYLCPLWIVGAAIWINQAFHFINVSALLSLETYSLILALAAIVPFGSILMFYGLRHILNEINQEESLLHASKACDKNIWPLVCPHISKALKLTDDESQNLRCEASVGQMLNTKYAVRLIFYLGQYALGEVALIVQPNATDDEIIQQAADKIVKPFRCLYGPSEFRTSLYFYRNQIKK